MYVFDGYIAFHIADRRGPASRDRWVSIFEKLLQCFNAAEIVGGWVGTKVTERDSVIRLEKWGVDIDEAHRIGRYLRLYQIEAKQEAVSIEIVIEGKWSSMIVEVDQWAQYHGRLEFLWNTALENQQLEDVRTQELLDYFSHKS